MLTLARSTEDIVPSGIPIPAPAVSPRTHSLPTCVAGEAAFEVGPLSPLKVFPPVMFTTAFDLAQKVAQSSAHGDPGLSALDYIAVLQLGFNLNNPKAEGEQLPFTQIRAILDPDAPEPHYVLQTEGGIIIDPFAPQKASSSSTQSVFLGHASAHALIQEHGLLPDPVVSPFGERVSRVVQQAIESRVTQGHPRLVLPGVSAESEGLVREAAVIALDAYRNSPYNGLLEERRADKANSRFGFIDALHSLRDGAENTQVLIDYIERRPSVLCLRGWCGGTVLHEAAEYGNVALVSYVTAKLRELSDSGELRDFRAKTTYTAEEVVNFRNRDGSTALQLAELHNRRAVIPLLLGARADALATSRFGDPALRHDLHTDRLAGERLSLASANDLRSLMNDAFSAPAFAADRKIMEMLVSEIVSGERSMAAGDRVIQLAGAYLWRLGDKPVAFGIVGVDTARPERFWLSYFGVASSEQGQGYGTEALRELRRNIARLGARDLFVQTSADPSNLPVLSFYQGNGFEPLTEVTYNGARFALMRANHRD